MSAEQLLEDPKLFARRAGQPVREGLLSCVTGVRDDTLTVPFAPAASRCASNAAYLAG